MIYIKERINIYCFDSSAFIDIGRTHDRIIPIPSLWDCLKKMMQNGQLISHRLVFNELSSNSKNPDFLARWVANKKQFFLDITPEQVKLVPSIIQKFPNLIDYKAEHEQADPWLIALAIEKSKELILFFINISIIVSQESIKSSKKKIPAICRCFKIKHNSLKKFLNNLNIKIQINSK